MNCNKNLTVLTTTTTTTATTTKITNNNNNNNNNIINRNINGNNSRYYYGNSYNNSSSSRENQNDCRQCIKHSHSYSYSRSHSSQEAIASVDNTIKDKVSNKNSHYENNRRKNQQQQQQQQLQQKSSTSIREDLLATESLPSFLRLAIAMIKKTETKTETVTVTETETTTPKRLIGTGADETAVIMSATESESALMSTATTPTTTAPTTTNHHHTKCCCSTTSVSSSCCRSCSASSSSCSVSSFCCCCCSSCCCACSLCSCNSITTKIAVESGFYKFLGRFSGRRRNIGQNLRSIASTIISILIITSILPTSEACSSRTIPKPRPPPTPTPRPNMNADLYECPSTYAAWYCLNEGRCFAIKIADEILYNCECATGYMGPRCEYKDLDGSYLPTRPRVMLETASIASGATSAFIAVLMLCLILYLRWHQKQKLERTKSNGVDTVDGLTNIVKCRQRPFGPHHYYTIPMAATLK